MSSTTQFEAGQLRADSLRVGDWVEVRSKEEILQTLDRNGQLEGMPFMPEMFAYCGKRLRVHKRAHKTCDTAFEFKARKMKDAVHLEDVRCSGESYGGCQASCMIFWKTAWLRVPHENGENPSARLSQGPSCTEADVLAGTRKANEGSEPVYVCQATQVPYATEPLPPLEWGQYVDDYKSGNVGLWRIIKSFALVGYRRGLVNLGIGLGRPLKWLYDLIQSLWGGVPYPFANGGVPAGKRTPETKLELQPGEWVRVKSHKEIMTTCDQSKMNRGMTFDPEMTPYCGRTFKVLKRITKILDEKTGKMMVMKNPCIILDTVLCQARYCDNRLFCPRSVYPYWREIWLERTQPKADSPREEKLTSLTT